MYVLSGCRARRLVVQGRCNQIIMKTANERSIIDSNGSDSTDGNCRSSPEVTASGVHGRMIFCTNIVFALGCPKGGLVQGG